MSDAELDAIRSRLTELRSTFNDTRTLLREVDRLRAAVAEQDSTGIHGIGCWLSEALGDAPDGAEPTAESLRLSAETLAKRITALADHLEDRPSDLDLGVYDGASGSFGRVVLSTRQLLADRAAFVRADEARVAILEQIWSVLGGPTLPADPRNEPPVSGDVEVDAIELARRVVADRDRLAARVAELEGERDDLKAMKIAYEQTPKQWSTAQAPTLEAIMQTANYYHAVAERDRLAARVAELEGRPSVPPPSLNIPQG